MESRTALIYTAYLIKKNGKLSFRKPSEQAAYKQFEESIPEGQSCEIYYSADVQEGTLSQLAAIHAMIRVLAKEVGVGENEMKEEVKRKGKYMTNGKYDSFADYNLEKLNSVKQTIYELAEFMGFNLR